MSTETVQTFISFCKPMKERRNKACKKGFDWAAVEHLSWAERHTAFNIIFFSSAFDWLKSWMGGKLEKQSRREEIRIKWKIKGKRICIICANKLWTIHYQSTTTGVRKVTLHFQTEAQWKVCSALLVHSKPCLVWRIDKEWNSILWNMTIIVFALFFMSRNIIT